MSTTNKVKTLYEIIIDWEKQGYQVGYDTNNVDLSLLIPDKFQPIERINCKNKAENLSLLKYLLTFKSVSLACPDAYVTLHLENFRLDDQSKIDFKAKFNLIMEKRPRNSRPGKITGI